MKKIFERIGKEIDLKQLSQEICKVYQLGEYCTHTIIEVGIDDLSYYLWTKKGKYVVKNLNIDKTLKEVDRFIKQYDIIMRNSIKAPNLLLNHGKHILLTELEGILIHSCVMECIDGQDLFSSKKRITNIEIDQLVEIMIALHHIKDKLEIEYDLWSFMKFDKVYQLVKPHIDKTQEMEKLLQKYKQINFSIFPTCYIHGDLISTNIMRSQKGELSLIDFTSSGTGIRILDIVKVINSVIFNYEKIGESKEQIEYFLEQYQKKEKLSKEELGYLPFLLQVDSHTSVMLAEYEKEKNQIDNQENEFWIANDKKLIELLKR